MTHIPVGTKLSITEYIPLPVPRPEVAELPKNLVKMLDYTPYVPVQGLDIQEKLGLDKMKEQINLVLEPISNFYNTLDWEFLVGLGSVSLMFLSIGVLVFFLTRPFR